MSAISYVITGMLTMTVMRHKGIALGHLHGIRQKGSVAFKFAGPKPHGVPWLVCDVGGLSQAPPKSITELREVLQVVWDSLPQEPINKAVNIFILQLKRCTEAGDGHLEDTKWLLDKRHQTNCSLYCLVTLFCCFDANVFQCAKIARWSL